MNKTEEKKYEQLKKLGQELHIPIPEHFIECEVTDKNGKVIQTLKQRSHSWVRNAYNLLLSQMASKDLKDTGLFGVGYLSIKDAYGAIKTGSAKISTDGHESITYGYRANAASISHGITVGSGTNAESFEDYVLQTPIAEGTGAGRLNHALMDVPSKSWSAPTFTITWIRYLNNNSGGNVGVNEVGLGTSGKLSASAYFMTSRDKLASTVTVPDTGQLKVTYTIQLTYPE